MGLFLLFKDETEYKRYMFAIMIGFSFTIIFCFLFPNGQDLRPTEFPRDNFLIDMMKGIYKVDTNTNVLPSVHAISAILVGYEIWKTKAINSTTIKLVGLVITTLVAISTCFVKQHSILDVFAAIALCYFILTILKKKYN